MGMYIRLLIASIYWNDEFYSSKEKPINSFFNKWHTIKWSLIDISDNFNESILKFILIILLLSLPYWLGTTIIYQQYGLGWLYPYFFILAWSISAFFIFSFLGRTVLEHYSPIYSFAHVWKKIQLLTSEIEKKSQAIGENFKKDMNFRVFSDGFDMLAETFSEIISLVIKLEKIEQKANKWNLFDSQKYIGSLRSDIVEPLQSLKLFLRNQREKLISSQKELQEVRIWGINSTDSSLHSGWQEQASGWQEHAELSSKRGEFLIHELDESTEKLNTMIAKMTH